VKKIPSRVWQLSGVSGKLILDKEKEIEMEKEIFQAVVNYHTALMGNDNREIVIAEYAFEGVKQAYGEEEVQKVLDKFNTMLREI